MPTAETVPPRTIAQFRPICVSNVIVKVVTKVIANRLKPVIRELVGAEQASFIPGCQTTDNIFIAQECLHSLRRKKGRTGVMMVKIDLEKAYVILTGFSCKRFFGSLE